MERQGLVSKAAKRFKVTTDSNHQLPIAPNLLDQDFSATAINQKWAGDITYLWTSEGWLYLAVIIDLYSCNVIGWSMNNRMTSDLVCDALTCALFRRGMPENVIIHSDRGSQYCSKDYRALIKKQNSHQSMSRKGNCWDNACVESFFHTFKVEAFEKLKFLPETKCVKEYWNILKLIITKREGTVRLATLVQLSSNKKMSLNKASRIGGTDL